MSTVKIQVIAGPKYESANLVLVDNKLAYKFGHPRSVEIKRLTRLIELLQLDNTEITDKEKV